MPARKRWIRLGIGLGCTVVALGVCTAIFWDDLLDAVGLAFAERILGEPEILRDGDLHLILCGTAGPVGDAGQRSSCNAVVADGEMLLVDAGAGGTVPGSALGLPMRQLSTILVTHLHHDHVAGIGDAIHGSWFVGRTRLVTVYGPPGIEEVVRGFGIAFAEDRRLRQLPGGGGLDQRWAIPEVRVVEAPAEDSVLVLERGRLRVRAFRADHGPVEPSLGYRIELADRSLVFNGDAKADAGTVRHARDADLLVNATIPFQWLATDERIDRLVAQTAPDFPDARRVNSLFSSPVAIARVAQQAGVDTIVFSHRMPLPWGTGWLALFGVSSEFDGDAYLGSEGMRFDLETSKPSG